MIFPTPISSTETNGVNWEGCEYSKCGRTDKGVSAFGQVIGVRVRSNRPLANIPFKAAIGEDAMNSGENGTVLGQPPSDSADHDPATMDDPKIGEHQFDLIRHEIPYTWILNRLLPPDIRMLAWCPTPPPGFSARFSCKERKYRYFFTQPAFMPNFGSFAKLNTFKKATPSERPRREGWLNIKAMQDAARRFVGLHDFRNFCKVDPSKQIENFERRIFHAEIKELDQASQPAAYVRSPGFQEYESIDASTGLLTEAISNGIPGNFSLPPKIYAFILHGSAFLWHQVRHMAAILFLVGQGLESPDLVSRLLDVKSNPKKPMYEMAEDAPLVLWDCVFPKDRSESRDDGLDWIYVGDHAEVDNSKIPRITSAKGNGKFGMGGVVDDMWKVWRQRKMDEVLAGILLNKVVEEGNDPLDPDGRLRNAQGENQKRSSQKVFHGGNAPRLKGKYIPVLQLPKMDSVEVINSRYAERKEFQPIELIV